MLHRQERKEKIEQQPVFNFFSILPFFNHYFRNESGETLFSNLALLSHVNPSVVIYKESRQFTWRNSRGWCMLGSSRWPGVPRRISHAS
jgi:hypothetical protein